MSAHKKRGGLFGIFKKKGDKDENGKMETDGAKDRIDENIYTAIANKATKKRHSTNISNSVVPNGVIPESDAKADYGKEGHSNDATVQPSGNDEVESRKRKHIKAKDEKQKCPSLSDQSRNKTVEDHAIMDISAKGDATTDILAKRDTTTDISAKISVSAVSKDILHQSEKAKESSGIMKEKEQHNATNIVKEEQKTRTDQEIESVKAVGSYEIPSRPGEHSPIPSDPSLTPRAASDNQSESTTDDGKVVSEEAELKLSGPTVINLNDVYPIKKPLTSEINRDMHVIPPEASNYRVSKIIEDRQSLGVQSHGFSQQPSSESLQNARSSLKSVSSANLPQADKWPSRNTDTISFGRNKVEMGIIHYSPESFAAVKQRNAQFGGLSPPPMKKNWDSNTAIVAERKPESKLQKAEPTAKGESATDCGDNPLQKEYARLRDLFDKWQKHCTDPTALKGSYTLKLQGELIAQLKLVQDLCSKPPPGHLVNHPPLTLPMAPVSYKKRPAIINYKFTPPSPQLPPQPQASSFSSEPKASKSSSQCDVAACSGKGSLQKKQTPADVTSNSVGRGIGTSTRPHSYTPLMRNEFCVPRMRQPNVEPRTTDVNSSKQQPTATHTITYGTAPSKQTNCCDERDSTVAASNAGKPWNSKTVRNHEIDEKGWITSTLRLGSSAKKDEQKFEKDSAFQRIQREIEMEAQRQRELNRMRQQLNKVTTIKEEMDGSDPHPPKHEGTRAKNSAQMSTKQTLKVHTKCTETKPDEKPSPSNVIRDSNTTTKNQPNKVITEKVQVNINTTSNQQENVIVKHGIVSALSKNFTEPSSQETTKVQIPRPSSTNSIKQVLQGVKLSVSSEHINNAAPTNKLDITENSRSTHVFNQSSSHRYPMNSSQPSPQAMGKANPSIGQANQRSVSTTKATTDQHSKQPENNGVEDETHQPITTNIRSIISSVKNVHQHIEQSSGAEQKKITHNEENYASGTQRRTGEDIEDQNKNTSGEQPQFVIPQLRKVGTPVERIGIQLGFVREDKDDAERGAKAGTSTSSSNMAALTNEHSRKWSISSTAESTNSVTVCTPSAAPPPPPPGPAPIIAELRTPRSESSLTNWGPPTSLGMSVDSRNSSCASLQTAGMESAGDRKERLRKSLSPFSTIDPAVLIAEMKKVQLRPTHPVQKTKTTISNDLRESLMREICDAGGIKSLKKSPTST